MADDNTSSCLFLFTLPPDPNELESPFRPPGSGRVMKQTRRGAADTVREETVSMSAPMMHCRRDYLYLDFYDNLLRHSNRHVSIKIRIFINAMWHISNI
jgi:hypothetical protein